MNEKEEEVLFSLRKTRKAFIPEYLCGFFLLIVNGVLVLEGIKLKPLFSYSLYGITALTVILPEYIRLFTQYKFFTTKMIIIKGIIQQAKQNVYFAPLAFIPNINTKQNRMQRIFGYGSISILGGVSPENHFEIKDINQPKQIMTVLENLIEENRTKTTTFTRLPKH